MKKEKDQAKLGDKVPAEDPSEGDKKAEEAGGVAGLGLILGMGLGNVLKKPLLGLAIGLIFDAYMANKK